MSHSIIELIVGLVLWKYVPNAVGLKDTGFERIIKIVLMIIGILMVIGGVIGLVEWII